MSMYNMVHGMNPHSGMILAALGLGPHDFDRFRDARVAAGEIAIYTRVGCRPIHEGVYDRMAEHPNFLRVERATHDGTYATFFFSFPELSKTMLEAINGPESFDPAKEFEQAMDNLKGWNGKGAAPIANPEGMTKLMDEISSVMGLPKR